MVVVTAGAIRRANLQPNITTNKPRPDALLDAQPTVSKHWKDGFFPFYPPLTNTPSENRLLGCTYTSVHWVRPLSSQGLRIGLRLRANPQRWRIQYNKLACTQMEHWNNEHVGSLVLWSQRSCNQLLKWITHWIRAWLPHSDTGLILSVQSNQFVQSKMQFV